MTFLTLGNVKWTLERMCCDFKGEGGSMEILREWFYMSGLLKNAALKGQMRQLSKAVLALRLLDSERPVQRKVSIQNFDKLCHIHGPSSLMVRTKLAMLRDTDLIPGVLSLM